ncbi:hypothetical protein V0R37_00475 [Pollutimonas sp. H1-120]|uniref:hypothetical protein n=1 Tax=Pollutimonas sp. H1-120 TaxID=3148824 RepID=UPI003B51C563
MFFLDLDSVEASSAELASRKEATQSSARFHDEKRLKNPGQRFQRGWIASGACSGFFLHA